MLFKIPAQSDFFALKSMDRKFEEFYLPSLKNLIETFERVALWCDETVAEYLRKNGLADKINMRVLKFNELPHTAQRDNWLKIMHGMRGNIGYFLRHKTPEQWINYLMVIMAKPAVMNWAAENNKFNSEYFMWLDAGGTNPIYKGFWTNWAGKILAQPSRVRMTIAPTLGKSRPRFVPRFIYDLYRKTQPAIQNATAELLAKQDLTDIAMINADYDVPATSFMIPKNLVNDFYTAFERTRKIMQKHNLISTEQAVFQAMMKFDVDNMFELKYIHSYTGVYAAVADKSPDHLL